MRDRNWIEDNGLISIACPHWSSPEAQWKIDFGSMSHYLNHITSEVSRLGLGGSQTNPVFISIPLVEVDDESGSYVSRITDTLYWLLGNTNRS